MNTKGLDMFEQMMESEQAAWVRAGFDRPIEADFSLEYQLNRLTKAELDGIRLHYNLKGVSKLKKPELVAALKPVIIEQLQDQLEVLDELTFDDLSTIVSKKGFYKDVDELSVDLLIHLRDAGIAFAGHLEGHGEVVIMPREVVQQFKQLQSDESLCKIVADNQKALLAIRGMLAYYGTISMLDLGKALAEMKIEMNTVRLYRLVAHIGQVNGYFDIVYPNLFDKRVVNQERLLELQENVLVDRYSFDYDTALKLAQHLYLDWEEEHRDLFDYLQDNFDLDDEEAAEVMMFYVFAVNNAIPVPFMLQHLGDFGLKVGTFEAVIPLLELMEKARKKTRLWSHKGYSPDELAEIASRPRLRVITSSKA